MGLISDFTDYATRNTDSTLSAQSTYTNLIGKDRVEEFEEEYPEISEDYEIDSDDMEERNYLQITDASGNDTFEGYTSEDIDMAVETVENSLPGVNKVKWLIVGIIGLVVLYLIRPLLQIIAGVTN